VKRFAVQELPMTDHEKLLRAEDILTDVIKDTQAEFLQATYFLNCKPVKNLTKEQKEEYLKQRNQTCLDIVAYKELLRRCYEVISIPDSEGE